VPRQKTYRYDTTDPTCGDTTLFLESDLNTPFNPENWTNQRVRAKVECNDLTGSQCIDNIVDAGWMSHMQDTA
jgi:hypothetical protein